MPLGFVESVAGAFVAIIGLGVVLASVADRMRISRLARKSSRGGSL